MKSEIEIKEILQPLVGNADMAVFATRWLSIIAGINAAFSMEEHWDANGRRIGGYLDISIDGKIMHPMTECIVDGHTITVLEHWVSNYDAQGEQLSSGRYLQQITIDNTLLMIDIPMWEAMMQVHSYSDTIHHEHLVEEINELMFDYFIEGSS